MKIMLIFFTLFLAFSNDVFTQRVNIIKGTNLQSNHAKSTNQVDSNDTQHSDKIVAGGTTTIYNDRYGNRTVTYHPPVTASARRSELNLTINSLKAKLFSVKQEDPSNTSRIKEIEDLLTKAEQELKQITE